MGNKTLTVEEAQSSALIVELRPISMIVSQNLGGMLFTRGDGSVEMTYEAWHILRRILTQSPQVVERVNTGLVDANVLERKSKTANEDRQVALSKLTEHEKMLLGLI